MRARLDWKYTLGLELTDPGFDFSVPLELRSRLIAEDQKYLLLYRILTNFKERDLLSLRGKQYTDSTHVHDVLRHLGRLDLIVETLWAALNQMAWTDPAWLQPRLSAEWVKRYARRGLCCLLSGLDMGRAGVA